MVFSSMEFLWLFLPAAFVVSRLLPKKAVNGWLLFVSLFFYAFGEPVYILLMLGSIMMNWLFGLAISPLENAKRKILTAAAVAANLLLLGYFKYFDFVITLVNTLSAGETVPLKNIALPIGISFYTFQILSYIIDLYRKKISVQKNLFTLALYISFFPQLIAGPIVNYRDVENQLSRRDIHTAKTSYGAKRFIWGLAKKVLIANTLAVTVDNILSTDLGYVPSLYLWLAYLLYALQIYYDFSGYSDMAIGLGKMFGFDFLENFNYPYMASSVTEFWRRWHISLSGWFRDNLYIPLGGNRRGGVRTAANIMAVFALTGLWHGAGLNFLAWGLWHGVLLVIERFTLSNRGEKDKSRVVPRRVYTLCVVFFGWVFFRAGSLTAALGTFRVMFSFLPGGGGFYLQSVAGPGTLAAAVIGILGAGPFWRLFPKLKERLFDEEKTGYPQAAVLALLLAVSIISIVSGSYNPFIYFRF